MNLMNKNYAIDVNKQIWLFTLKFSYFLVPVVSAVCLSVILTWS